MNRQQQIDAFLLAAHRLALSRLRAEPGRIEEVARALARWRLRAGPNRTDPYWDEWQSLLDSGIDALEAGACRLDEHGTELRNVSPIGVLITARERGELLRAARRSTNASQ